MVGIIEMRDPNKYLIINLPVRFVGNDAVEYFVLNILYYSIFQIFSQHLQPHNPLLAQRFDRCQVTASKMWTVKMHINAVSR